jgi:hypothetical protein
MDGANHFFGFRSVVSALYPTARFDSASKVVRARMFEKQAQQRADRIHPDFTTTEIDSRIRASGVAGICKCKYLGAFVEESLMPDAFIRTVSCCVPGARSGWQRRSSGVNNHWPEIA